MFNNYIFFCIGLLFTFCVESSAQEENFRIAFYNVENLFHPDDDSLKNDEEFTPEGNRHWNDYLYRSKSNRMAKAILSIGGWEAPAIVGLAEVENRKVVEDLAGSDVLRKFGYGIVHYESPDRRGIDVAMLYRKNLVTVMFARNYPVTLADNPDFATRDILYAKAQLQSGDTIHLMYCHWPSRYGGQARSEPNRIEAAKTVRMVVDSVLKDDPEARVIIAGDFNDEWDNISLREYLKAGKEINPAENTLVNLMSFLPEDEGSHRYRGVWAYLDQMIVSSSLLDTRNLDVRNGKAEVLKEGFLLEQDDRYPGQVPFRTFTGMKYHGGFSDHLPVYIDLTYYSR